jgi:sugar lactone lactonase YvrE
MGPVARGGAKLVCVDLNSNQVIKKIGFPQDVALEKSYLNDVRFDLTRGKGGYAYITDSSTEGSNGIVVVDLDSGKSWRRLNDHPSTKPEPNFLPIVEGQKLMMREPGQQPKSISFGSDGIAISADGRQLYYCPLASRRLFSVSTDALIDQSKSDEEVGKTVRDLGVKCASDGLESDSANRVYATDYEKAAIRSRDPDGTMRVVVQDPRLIWPDTMSLAQDGYLYVTANQLDRQARFWNGEEKRVKPYAAIFRVKVDASPVRLVK